MQVCDYLARLFTKNKIMTQDNYTTIIINTLVLCVTQLSWTSISNNLEYCLKITVLSVTIYVTIHKHILTKREAKRNERLNNKV